MKNSEKKQYYRLFVKFLRDNGIYDEFIREMRKNPSYYLSRKNISPIGMSDSKLFIKYFLSLSDRLDKLASLISAPFSWETAERTRNDYNFWITIHQQWEKLIFKR